LYYLLGGVKLTKANVLKELKTFEQKQMTLVEKAVKDAEKKITIAKANAEEKIKIAKENAEKLILEEIKTAEGKAKEESKIAFNDYKTIEQKHQLAFSKNSEKATVAVFKGILKG